MSTWELWEPFLLLAGFVLVAVVAFWLGTEAGRESTLSSVQSTLKYLLYRSGQYDDISDQLMQDIRDGVRGNTPPRRP